MMFRALGRLLVVFAVAGAVGCSGDSDESSVADQAGDAVEAAEAVGQMAKDRVSEGSRQVQGRGGVSLPEGFPIYAGAVPSSEVPESDLFRWDTADAVPTVGDFYSTALAEAPWGLFSSNRMSATAQVFVFKRAGETLPFGRVSLAVAKGGRGTTILLDLN